MTPLWWVITDVETFHYQEVLLDHRRGSYEYDEIDGFELFSPPPVFTPPPTPIPAP